MTALNQVILRRLLEYAFRFCFFLIESKGYLLILIVEDFE